MIAARFSFGIVLLVALALPLSSCAHNPPPATGTKSSGETLDGSPLVPAERIDEPQKSAVVYSDEKLLTWRLISNVVPFVPIPSTASTAAKLVVTGDGHPIASELLSTPISVKPGQTYTFSARIDPSNVAGGYPVLWVSNAVGNELYRSSKIFQKQPGRYGLEVRIPDHVSQISLGFYTNGCLLAQGAKMTFSRPLLAVGNAASKTVFTEPTAQNRK